MASHQQLADRLYHAHQNGPIAPLRDGLAPDDVEGAYDVQALVTQRWRDDGRKLVDEVAAGKDPVGAGRDASAEPRKVNARAAVALDIPPMIPGS